MSGNQNNYKEKDPITTDPAQAEGGIYAVIGGVIYYHVNADYPVDY